MDEGACVPHRYHEMSDTFLHNLSIMYLLLPSFWLFTQFIMYIILPMYSGHSFMTMCDKCFKKEDPDFALLQAIKAAREAEKDRKEKAILEVGLTYNL